MEFGSNLFEWAQSQAIPIFLLIYIVLTISCIAKRSLFGWISVTVMFMLASVAVFNPETISDLGQNIFQRLFG
ncbi:hypothetical protein [Halobacillus sp. H74]|uniref:hypothetical protein n=1 Tax=Halobacillus sp. H74 TaxID=3457436 RepID=UPI003FCE9B44